MLQDAHTSEPKLWVWNFCMSLSELLELRQALICPSQACQLEHTNWQWNPTLGKLSLCALPSLFHSPNSFANPPPRFSLCYSCYANCSGPFVFEYSLCQPHGPSSILSSGPAVPFPAGFICLILLQSGLLLNSPCASLATPIALDRLFLNDIRSVSHVVRAAYCPPVLLCPLQPDSFS